MIEALRELPPDATVDDAIERLVFLAKLEAGLAELDRGDVNASSVERDVDDVRRDDLLDQEWLQAESGGANPKGLLKRRIEADDVIALNEHNFTKMACAPFLNVRGEHCGFAVERLFHTQSYRQV